MYGISVLSCMSSAMSSPDGAGLGTLGLSEAKAREMSAAADFGRFRRVHVDNRVNAFYDIDLGVTGHARVAQLATTYDGQDFWVAWTGPEASVGRISTGGAALDPDSIPLAATDGGSPGPPPARSTRSKALRCASTR